MLLVTLEKMVARKKIDVSLEEGNARKRKMNKNIKIS